MTSSTTTALLSRKGVLTWSAVLLTVGLTTSACQSVTPDAAAQGTPSASATRRRRRPPRRPRSASPRRTAPPSVRPDAPVTVTASNGTLSEVTVTATGGVSIEGELSADKTVWTASGGLKPKTTYTVSATAVNADGASTSMTSTLRTLTPKDTANYTVIPSSGVVGVGMPVVIQFVSPVDKDKRADVEKRVKVTATPAVKGTWGWLDGRQLIFRPSKYWKAGTKVHVTADVAGIETKKDLWTSTNASTRPSRSAPPWSARSTPRPTG